MEEESGQPLFAYEGCRRRVRRRGQSKVGWRGGLRVAVKAEEDILALWRASVPWIDDGRQLLRRGLQHAEGTRDSGILCGLARLGELHVGLGA